MGSLMRHKISLSTLPPVLLLTSGVVKPALALLLIEAAGLPESAAPGVGGAGGRTVPLPAVAASAEEELAPTGESAADDQS